MSTSETPKENVVNGVSIDSVIGLVNAVKENEEKANTEWKASTVWGGGFKCNNKIRDFEYVLDEPEGLGGTNQGPNMVEAVAAAYGSCLTVGYILNASKEGIEVDELTVNVAGKLNLRPFLDVQEGNAGFHSVETSVDLKTADADAAKLLEIHDYVLKTSPVGNILSRAISVETKLASEPFGPRLPVDLEGNGVPLDAVKGLVAAVTDDESKSETVWKSSTSWGGGLECTNTIRKHDTITLDEPPALGGTNKGPNMVEYVLGAYTACLTVGYVLNASRRNIKVNSLAVRATGKLDLHPFLGLKEGNAGFSSVTAEVDIDLDGSDEDLAQLHEDVVRTSPVGNILRREIRVDTNLVSAA